MRKAILIMLTMIVTSGLSAQEKKEIKGTVSYVTSQNVYVKFLSTTGLEKGDTLMAAREGRQVPALLIENLSSISCVCRPLLEREFKTGEVIIAERKNLVEQEEELEEQPPTEDDPGVVGVPDVQESEDTEKAKRKQDIYGRIGISSYSSFTNEEDGDNHRMRYVVSVNGKNISGSRAGFESYIAFTHRDEQWDLIQANIYEGLKVYGLSVDYNFRDDSRVWLGRKINPKLSSMGAVDGIQFEKSFGNFSAGAIVGSRPDLEDYSYNADFFQAGAFLAHEKQSGNKFFQSSVAVVDQENKWNTDRRFLYVQHSNSLLKDLFLFVSGEVDLYERIEGVEKNTFNFTNAYLSLRYKLRKNLRFSASYSARNNIIYYETYKDFIQKLIEYETLQGFRFSAHYRPFSKLSLGARAGYRYRKDDDSPTRNLYAYMAYNRIPYLQMNATFSATLLETSYIDGKVFGLFLNRDILKGQVYAGLSYKYTDYAYLGAEDPVVQHSAELSVRWKVMKKLYLSVNNEFVMEDQRNFDRLYLSLNQRF